MRLTLDPFVDEAGPFGMALRALVESVDLVLEPVKAALPDQAVLQEPGGVVGETAAAEVGMNRDPA